MRKKIDIRIVDGKRIIKNLIIFLLILTVTILGAVCFSIERKETTSSAADTALPVQIIESAFPAIHAANNGYQRLQDTASDGIASAASLLFSFNPFDAETILSAEFPTVKLISSGGLVRLALAQRAEAPAATPAPTAAPTPAPTEARLLLTLRGREPFGQLTPRRKPETKPISRLQPDQLSNQYCRDARRTAIL